MDKSKRKDPRSWRALFATIGALRLPWLWILLGLALNLAANTFLLRLPDTTAELTSGNISAGALVKAIWFYVMFGLMNTIAVAGQTQAQSYSVRRTRESVWKKMLSLRMDYFDRNDPSELMSAITSDSGAALDLVNIILNLIPAIYYVVAAMWRISEYHWMLALSCFALFPLKYLYALIMGRVYQKSSARLYDRIGVLTGFLADRLSHLTLIKVFGTEKREKAAGEQAAQELYKANMRIVHQENIAVGIVSVLDVAQKFVVIVVAVLLLQQKKIDLTMWLAFFLFSQNLFTEVDMVFDYWTRIKGLQGSFQRVNEIMQGDTESDEAALPLPETGDIEFKNVTFTYPETDKPALDHVSFTIPRGSSVAIVGLCGSGKTTTVSLLERFYTPDEGEILIGGTDIRALSLGDFRRSFAYVQQGADVFGGTLREALTYGIDRDVTDAEIYAAAERTGFAEYLAACENGLDAAIASDGGSMSGGQNQRLVITRELLRGGDIVLMDEPTSALDVRVSEKIQETMDTLFADKTRILITHDLAFAKRYDRIVVLSDGAVAGIGTHGQLMASCERYRQMEMEAAV